MTRYTSIFRFLIPVILFLNLTLALLVSFSYINFDILKTNDPNININKTSQAETVRIFLPFITAIVSMGIGFFASRTEARAKKDKISQAEKMQLRREDLQNLDDIVIRKIAELKLKNDSMITQTINQILNILEEIETSENSQSLVKKAEIAEELVKSISEDKKLKENIRIIINIIGVDDFLKRINHPILKIVFTDKSTLEQMINN